MQSELNGFAGSIFLISDEATPEIAGQGDLIINGTLSAQAGGGFGAAGANGGIRLDSGQDIVFGANNITGLDIDIDALGDLTGTGTITSTQLGATAFNINAQEIGSAVGSPINIVAAGEVTLTTTGTAANTGDIFITTDSNNLELGVITVDTTNAQTVDIRTTTTGDITVTDASNLGNNATLVLNSVDALTLNNNLTAGTGGIDIDAGGNISGAGNLTTSAAVDSGVASGDVTIDSGAAIALTGSITTTGANRTASSGSAASDGGAVTINAATTLGVGAITTSGGDHAGAGNNDDGGNAGAGSLDSIGANTITLNGNIVSAGGDGVTNGDGGDGAALTFADPVVLGATVELDTRGGSGAAAGTAGGTTFNGTVDATTGGVEGLTVRGGTIDFNGVVGTTRLGAVVLSDSTQVDIDAAFNADSFTATSNITTFDSSGFIVDATNASAITTQGDLTVSGLVTGPWTLQWGQDNTGATLTLSGGVTGTATGGAGDDIYTINGGFISGLVDGGAETTADIINGTAITENGDEGTVTDFESIGISQFNCTTAGGTCTVSNTDKGPYFGFTDLVGTNATYQFIGLNGDGITDITDAGTGQIDGHDDGGTGCGWRRYY